MRNAFFGHKRAAGILFFAVIAIGGLALLSQFASRDIVSDLSNINRPPSFTHPFGTDWLGRDMFTRTMAGLFQSVRVGILSAAASAGVALVMGIAAGAFGKRADAAVSWLTDLFMGIPHILLLVLISFCLGGGERGVMTGIALTHWPSLARVVRAEVMQVRGAEYVLLSRRMGKSRLFVVSRHILPHLLPQLAVGTLLLFPHAVLHESAVTFLGFGLSPHQPAMGIILSESLAHLTSGMWWLAGLPGLTLSAAVLLAVWLTSRLKSRTAIGRRRGPAAERGRGRCG